MLNDVMTCTGPFTITNLGVHSGFIEKLKD